MIISGNMTFITTWEEFAKAAERLYLTDPSKVELHLSLLYFPKGQTQSEMIDR